MERNNTFPSGITALYRSGALAARLLPGPLANVLPNVVGASLAPMLREKRHVVERNIKRVVGADVSPARMRSLVAESFESYTRYWVEAFRITDASKLEIDANFTRDGTHHIDDALAKGNGVIFALPHLGGWECAGRWIADQGYKITVVVEALEPPDLFDWFKGLRENYGMRVVPLGPSAGAVIAKALKDNEIVCLLCDRDISKGGTSVEFFGERTTLPSGPAMLALRSGAPILPVACYFRGRKHHHAIIRPPLDLTRTGSLREDVARVTQSLANELEFLIRQAPEQWHLFQPNWPSDPGYTS